MSLRGRLICFADFVGMTLFALRFLLPLPNCVLKVCLPTLLAAETINLRKNGLAVLSITCASASKPRPRCGTVPLETGICTCLEATILYRLLG